MQQIVVTAAVCCALALQFCISAPAEKPAENYGVTAQDYRTSLGEGGYFYGESDARVDAAPKDSTPTGQISSHHILSRATGQFVAITRSGQVSANKEIGKSSHASKSHTEIS